MAPVMAEMAVVVMATIGMATVVMAVGKAVVHHQSKDIPVNSTSYHSNNYTGVYHSTC